MTACVGFAGASSTSIAASVGAGGANEVEASIRFTLGPWRCVGACERRRGPLGRSSAEGE